MLIHRVRTVALRHLGATRLSRQRIGELRAVVENKGWLANSWPTRPPLDRTLVLIRANHILAPLFRETSKLGIATLSRGLVESRTRCILDQYKAGIVLGRHGLLIRRCDDHNVVLQGVNPQLGQIINSLRYRTLSRLCTATISIQAALDMPRRPRRLTDTMRLHAAEVFEHFGVDASDLLSYSPRVRLRSNWSFWANRQPSNREER